METGPAFWSSRMTVWFVCLCALTICRMTLVQGTGWTHYSVFPTNSTVAPHSIQCARKFKASQYRVLRIRSDGSDCEVLADTWLQSPTYDSGFVYLRKRSTVTVTTMDPPSQILKTPTELAIPGKLRENSKIELVISSPNFQNKLWITLKEKASVDYIMQLTFRTGDGDIKIGHTANGQIISPIYAEFPFASEKSAYTITFVVKADSIEGSVDNVPWFNFSTVGKLSPIAADIVLLKTGFAEKKFYVDQFTFFE